jgi:hypothetical protein
MVSDPLAQRIRSLFRALLPTGTKVRVTRLGDLDHLAEIAGEGLRVRSVGRGDLRNVRLALQTRPKPHIIVASRFSEMAREEISAAKVNWADETGAAEISTRSMIINLSGRRRPIPRPSSIWTAAALGAAEAILAGINPTAEAISRATGYSLSTGVRTLAFLLNEELLESSSARGRRSGRRVVDQDRLLDEFADAAHQVRPKFEIRCGVLWREPFVELETIGERWNKADIDWAAAGAMAASVQAPFLAQTTTGMVYVNVTGELGLLHVARLAGLEPLDGGRLILRPFPTSATKELAEVIDDIWVTSWPRTYADLRFEGVRGEEAAEHLRKVSLAR